MNKLSDRIYAQQLDAQDALAPFRQRFVITDPNLIYLDGNSLGRLPQAAGENINHLVQKAWGDRLIRGWNEGWIEAPARVGGQIAHLLGAQADEVIMADSTSVNLFKLLLAALQSQPDRHKIVTDTLNFPSDLYIMQGAARLLKREIEIVVVDSPDGVYGPVDGLAEALDEDTAVLSLSHTVFKSGYTYDMAALTQLAHQAGALTLWDLSHSAGSVLVDLNGAQADLAVGCTYKYLNGGPGSPAFLYVRRDLQEKLHNPISGWMGQQNAFDFGLTYEAAAGLQRFLTGTPSILAITAVAAGVDLLLEAGMERLRAKSVAQTDYLIALWQEWLAPLGFRLNSPRESRWRGSHVSLGHDDGWRIAQALIQETNVLPDFRRPDNIRLGITPLYTTYTEIYEALARLRRVVTDRLYEKYEADMTDVVT
jgi:kynureninase